MDDEINKYIHTEIMGKCVDCQEIVISPRQECVPFGSMPNYCSDASPRWLLDEVVLQVVGDSEGDVYHKCLTDQLWETAKQHLYGDDDTLRPMQIVTVNDFADRLTLFAKAVHIATACVEAHKALKQSES